MGGHAAVVRPPGPRRNQGPSPPGAARPGTARRSGPAGAHRARSGRRHRARTVLDRHRAPGDDRRRFLSLRIAMHLGLLHEVHDPSHADEPILCEYCEMGGAGYGVLPACGVAARASSRRSVMPGQGESPPQPVESQTVPAEATAEQAYPGFAVPVADHLAPTIRRPRFSWLLTRWGRGDVRRW